MRVNVPNGKLAKLKKGERNVPRVNDRGKLSKNEEKNEVTTVQSEFSILKYHY